MAALPIVSGRRLQQAISFIGPFSTKAGPREIAEAGRML
jgi:hypothetical protein